MRARKIARTCLSAAALGLGCVAAWAAATNELNNAARPNGGRGHREGPYERHVKRPLDATLAAAGLVALSPVMAATAVAVRAGLGSPVLFEQGRPGLGGRVFRMRKFRTMTDARDESGNLLPDAERLTPLGSWLRSASLDELPELWSVLRGDMALVGPRPLLPEYLPRYTPEQARRHEVRPGLTGLAQIHGRNATTWGERLAWDARYVESVTLAGDLRILADTVRVVLSREGVHAEGEATMGEFRGAGGDVA